MFELFDLSAGGCVIARHGQWLGVLPGRPNVGRSFREGLRSERKALLLVLGILWTWYRSSLPSTDGVTVGGAGGLSLDDYIEVLTDEASAC